MLRRGGNAVDAAIAVSVALGVVEPFASGLGGGGFMMIWRRGALTILDGRSVTPAAYTPERFYPNGVAPPYMPKTGPMAPSIPGLPRMLSTAHREFGSMALPELVAPAILAAREGFAPGRLFRYAISLNEWVLRANRETARIYLADRIVQPELARTLETLARDGFDAFYDDTLLRAMDGIWIADDLDYKIVRREPVRGRYRDLEIAGMPPPSRGGLGLIGILDRVRDPEDPIHLTEVFHEVISRLDDQVGDSPSTTHTTIQDGDGTIVCLTQTLNHFFGSGFMISGVLLNDDVSEMHRAPGHPNSVAPRKRAATNMAPTIIFRDGAPYLAMGSPGFRRIITAEAQVLLNLVHRGLSLADAVARPRLHVERRKIFAEADSPELPALRARARRKLIVRPARDPWFGGIHAICGTEGAADPRREGTVEVV